MKIRNTVAAAFAGLMFAPAMASAAVIGGTNYAAQYDYSEFFSIADHHDFKVVLAGDAFANRDLGSVARDLLPVMQAAKPRPALTFAYDVAAEKDQPDYRLMLVFNAANDLGSKEVCNGVTRGNPAQPGLFRLYAVYCRNNVPMSETTAWTPASSSADPQVAELFRELFMVVWPDSHALKPQVGDGGRR